MRGRKPTPNAILKKSGSRAARKDEPELTGGFGDPPPEMNARALEVWSDVVADLEAIGIGSRIEAYALAEYCRAVAQSEEAAAQLERDGLVAVTERGMTKHPAQTIQATAALRILKFASEFGLTPASRGRIHGPPKEESNDFEEF